MSDIFVSLTKNYSKLYSVSFMRFKFTHVTRKICTHVETGSDFRLNRSERAPHDTQVPCRCDPGHMQAPPTPSSGVTRVTCRRDSFYFNFIFYFQLMTDSNRSCRESAAHLKHTFRDTGGFLLLRLLLLHEGRLAESFSRFLSSFFFIINPLFFLSFSVCMSGKI